MTNNNHNNSTSIFSQSLSHLHGQSVCDIAQKNVRKHHFTSTINKEYVASTWLPISTNFKESNDRQHDSLQETTNQVKKDVSQTCLITYRTAIHPD